MGLDVAGVWDIETSDWSTFVVGQATSIDGETFVSWDEDTFFTYLLTLRGVWYAHAGGTFDSIWLVDNACRRGIKWSAMMRGAGLLSVTIGKAEFRDSFALIPMSLEKASKMGAHTKIGLSLPDGYEGLSRKLNAAEKRAVEEYLDADCQALLSLLDTIGHGCESRGIDLKLTVGGSAWATARNWLNLPKSKHTHARYAIIRQGYYGGRTEVFRTHAPTGQRYDIHSSYPAALARVALPYGEPVRIDGRGAGAAYANGKEGIFSADVYVPMSTSIPPLPVRTDARLLYPIGDITGVWTGLELRRAEENGAKIERVRWAYVFPKSAPLLAPFAERVWKYRADSAASKTPDGDAWAAWFKWLANSLTGKLAQRPEKEGIRFEPVGPSGVPALEEHERRIQSTPTGAFITTETSRIDACAHVEWSAYLTAEARTELGAQLRHAPTPLYCDTDSVYARETLTRRVGDELGEWGHEGELRDWKALAPKVYRYEDPKKGKIVVKGKGLSALTDTGFAAIEAGEKWRVDRGVSTLKTSLRHGTGEALFRRKLLERGLHPVKGWVGGRILHEDGSTSATTLENYETR
jgi:hypothetical protein